MDILEMATSSGMQVILDGRIGTESYQSVCGSVQALQRFAEALRAAAASETQDLVKNSGKRTIRTSFA